MPRALTSAAVAVGMFLLWILLVGGWKTQEALLGVAATALAVAFAGYMSANMEQGLWLRPRDLAQGLRVPGEIVSNALLVCRVLVLDLFKGRTKSALNVYGFDASAGNPVKRGREVLAVLYMTASPGTIVLGMDETKHEMTVHNLVDQPLSATGRALGAGDLA